MWRGRRKRRIDRKMKNTILIASESLTQTEPCASIVSPEC